MSVREASRRRSGAIRGRYRRLADHESRADLRLVKLGRIDAAQAHIDDLDALRDLAAEDPAKAWMR